MDNLIAQEFGGGFDEFDADALASNPDPRCSVVLVLDCSSSMAEKLEGEDKSPLEALNDGLDVLVTELNRDQLAKQRVEISIVTYGSQVNEPTPFSTIDKLVIPNLAPSGITSTGAAVVTALDALNAKKSEYKANGIDYYRPWVLLITDGRPTDDITEAAARVKAEEAAKRLAFFAVGVEGADFDKLSQISTREPMKLQGMKFNELFVWLSASQAAVSASTPGDAVPLPAPSGWAVID